MPYKASDIKLESSLKFQPIVDDPVEFQKYKIEVERESQSIGNTPEGRQNRTDEEIEDTVNIGKPAEFILVSRFDFEFIPRKYADIISSDGVRVEVKTVIERKNFGLTDWVATIPQILKRIDSVLEYNRSEIKSIYTDVTNPNHGRFDEMWIFLYIGQNEYLLLDKILREDIFKARQEWVDQLEYWKTQK